MTPRTVLVTGAARGVGRAIAERLADRGYRLVLHCFHSFAEGRQLLADLQARGVDAYLVRANLARRSEVERMFEEVRAVAPVLDGLVNNAASGRFVPVLDDIAEADLDRALDLNLKGTLWCSLAARPLLTGPHPAIVNLSSIGASLVPASYLPVGVSKAALEALTRYLAVELAPQGIRVNTASAGMVDGDVARQFPEYPSMRRVIERATPLGRVASADDLAALTEFLLSEDSAYITGQVVLADGGLSLGSAMLRPEPVAAPEPEPEPVAVVAVPEPEPRPHLRGDAGPGGIAIVGMGVVLPGVGGVEQFWDALARRPELFSETPPDRWRTENFLSADRDAEDKTYQARSGYIAAGASPAGPDYTETWLRDAVTQALVGVTVPDGASVCTLVGYTPDGSHHLQESLLVEGFLERLEADAATRQGIRTALRLAYPRWSADVTGYRPHVVARQAVAGLLTPGNEVLTVDTACSSSLYAMDIGMRELVSGRRDVVVCAGSFALAPTNSVLFAKLHGLSPSGEVRSLDRDCDGVLFSDGAAAVVLKRTCDALADGDPIAGYLVASGTSSDGKGKGIYAPNAYGQRLAVDRAYERSHIRPGDVDWVIAHATGTPAGDESELGALGEAFAGVDHPVHVTSNKSLVGHSGWAAGVVSVVNALLAIRHGTIPAQHRFRQGSHRLSAEGCTLVVPTTDVAWPARTERARCVAVSGFGFGGTNAHLVVSDRPAPEGPAPDDGGAGGGAAENGARDPAGDVVIVAWAGDFPDDDPAAVRRWLSGDRSAAPPTSFGPEYVWSPTAVRPKIPPRTLRTIDRCQHMIIRCAEQLRDTLGEAWGASAATAAVLVGHMGPTRNSALYALRCHLDDIEDSLLRSGVQTPAGALAELRRRVQGEVRPSNEDSFPGIMPNVIPARVSNYFGLNGPNLTVDAGFASVLAAVHVGAQYLRHGGVGLALIGGSSGNNLQAMSTGASRLRGTPSEASEGTLLMALMRRADAERFELPVLATVVDGEDFLTAAPAVVDVDSATCTPERTYMGADGALAIVAALSGGRRRVVIRSQDADSAAFEVQLDVNLPTARSVPVEVPVEVPVAVPVAGSKLDRYTCSWEPEPGRADTAPAEALPAGCVVVTNAAELAVPLLAGRQAILLSISPVPGTPIPGTPSVHVIESPNADEVAALLPPDVPLHVRCLVDVSRLVDAHDQAGLHDLAFLVAQQVARRGSRGSSFLTVLVAGLSATGTPAPVAGLFTGLVKSVSLELESAVVRCVVTDRTDLGAALAEMVGESALAPTLPGVWYRGGERLVPRIVRAPRRGRRPLIVTDDDVVVAVGGARGITAEVLKDLTTTVRPAIFVIGRKDLDGHARRLEDHGGPDGLTSRAAFISSWRKTSPGRSVGEANARFEQLTEVADSLRTLALLRDRCGAGRVRYLTADVMDATATRLAVGEILDSEEHVGLLLYAAGANRASALASKTLADFRFVRDVKHLGYLNVRAAFGDRLPRTWVNFGSFIGLTGQIGEPDYASGNDFLDMAAVAHSREGLDERTIGWAYWREVGLGANAVMAAFLEKSGLYTPMSTREGVRHFRAELSSEPLPLMFQFGELELAAVRDKIPGAIRDEPRPPAPPSVAATPSPPALPPFVSRVALREEGRCDVEVDFRPAAFGLLEHHLVRGRATLPGMFVPEMAAEAAAILEPSRIVVGFRNIAFRRFLRLEAESLPGSTKRVEARTVHRDSESTVVRVEVVGPVVSPDGHLLRDRVTHFELDVVLADQYPAAPRWQRWPPEDAVPVSDPYHVEGSDVLLTGPFVTTTATAVTPRGMRARLQLDLGPHEAWLERLAVPVMALDGLARVAVLDPRADRWLPIVAPRSVGRIDLYRPLNDVALSRLGEAVELYVTPRGLDVQSSAPNRFVACLGSGEVLFEMNDVMGVELAHYDLADRVVVPLTALARVGAPA